MNNKEIEINLRGTNHVHFNPLLDYENEVIEFLLTAYEAERRTSEKIVAEMVLRYGIEALKALDRNCGAKGKYATLWNLCSILQATGKSMILKLSQLCMPTPEEAKRNADLVSFFMNEYRSEDRIWYKQLLPVIARLQLLNLSRWSYLLNTDGSDEQSILIQKDDQVRIAEDLDCSDFSEVEKSFLRMLRKIFESDDD